MVEFNVNQILKKSDTAFLTTIFPSCMVFFDQFLKSLYLQTDKNFDLFIVNDGVVNFEKYFEEYKGINHIEIYSTNSIVENRRIGIEAVKRLKYKYLIFGDSDDYFDSKRVFVSKQNLETFDIVVNDLNLFDSGGLYKEKFISKRLKDATKVDLEFIKEKNIFGLTNTALRVKVIEKLDLCENLIAFDWYFFSKLLYENKSAVFTNQTQTFYRQHKNNTVGLGDDSLESIKNAVRVKKIHYQCMAKISDYFDKILAETNLLEENIENVDFEIGKIKHTNLLWWETPYLIINN